MANFVRKRILFNMKYVCSALLVCLLVSLAAPSDAQRARTPKQSGQELSAICKKAGHAPTAMKRCAQMITALCRKKRINPKSKRCWQWVLEQNDRRRLDMKALRR